MKNSNLAVLLAAACLLIRAVPTGCVEILFGPGANFRIYIEVSIPAEVN